LWQQEVVLWRLKFVVFLSGVVGLRLLGYRIFQEKRKRPMVHSFHAHSIGPHLPTQKNWKGKIPNSGGTQSSGGVVSTYAPTSIHSYEWLILIYTHTICDDSVGTWETYFNPGSDLTSMTSAFPS
jgi:hypothetical protein